MEKCPCAKSGEERLAVRAWRQRGETPCREGERESRGEVEKPRGESSWGGEETPQIFGEPARSLSGASSGDVALCRSA